MTASYHLTHLHLRDAASALIVAHWTPQQDKAHHVREARNCAVYALAACKAGTATEHARETLLDVIATAIIDSTDLDCTAASQAEAVLAAILDNAFPMPEEVK